MSSGDELRCYHLVVSIIADSLKKHSNMSKFCAENRHRMSYNGKRKPSSSRNADFACTIKKSDAYKAVTLGKPKLNVHPCKNVIQQPPSHRCLRKSMNVHMPEIVPIINSLTLGSELRIDTYKKALKSFTPPQYWYY